MIHIDLSVESEAAKARATSQVAEDNLPLSVLLKRAWRDPFVIAAVLVALAAYGGTRYAMAGVQTREAVANEELTNAMREGRRLQGSIQRAEQLHAEQARLASSVAAIRSLDPDRYAWVRLMDQVAVATPENVWLAGPAALTMDSFDISTGAVGFRVRGFAPSVELASALQARLSASSPVSSSYLTGTSATEIAGFPVVQFEIAGTAGGQDRASVGARPVVAAATAEPASAVYGDGNGDPGY